MTRLQGGHCSRARWAPPLGKLSAISGISGLSWFQPRAWEKEEGSPPSAVLLRRTERQNAKRPGKATQSHHKATTKPYTRHILGIDSGVQSHPKATPKPHQSHLKATSKPGHGYHLLARGFGHDERCWGIVLARADWFWFNLIALKGM